MPKLNDLQLAERVRERIEQLMNGNEVAARDVRALLTEQQYQQLEAAWQQQQQLRKNKRVVSAEQQRALGWRSKRELRIEAFKQAIAELEQNTLASIKHLQLKSEARRSRIYLETYFAERDSDATKQQAATRANNALTRAGLLRIDVISVNRINKRDKEIREMEDRLKKQLGLDDDGKDGDA